MGLVGFASVIAVAVGLCGWLALLRLRKFDWWASFLARCRSALKRLYARLRGLCGNSKTIGVAYSAELLGILDEANLLDWSELVGSEQAGRVMVVMGVVMIVLRLVTRSAVSFRPEA